MKEVDYDKLAKEYGHDVKPELMPFRAIVKNKWRSDSLDTHPMNKQCGAHFGMFSDRLYRHFYFMTSFFGISIT